ncbi:hypothetical protein EON77_10485 [bacterium]|nr:MAG: hypothetical protein EON77_10485 [bacterium]
MALAGEAAGFAIERRGSDLHLKSTRSFSLETLEREAMARTAPYKTLPADVLTALPAYLAADGVLDRELARKPRDPARVAEARSRREALIGVSSPQRLVLARFLARGGTLPVGRTVLVRFGDYVKPREYGIYSTWTEEKPVPQFAAFRANDQEIEIALDPAAIDRTLYAWAEPLPIAPEARDKTEEKERATTLRDLAAVPWTKTAHPFGARWGAMASATSSAGYIA